MFFNKAGWVHYKYGKYANKFLYFWKFGLNLEILVHHFFHFYFHLAFSKLRNLVLHLIKLFGVNSGKKWFQIQKLEYTYSQKFLIKSLYKPLSRVMSNLSFSEICITEIRKCRRVLHFLMSTFVKYAINFVIDFCLALYHAIRINDSRPNR